MTHGEFGTSGLSDALVILGAAGLVIPTFARFRISPVIGFILVGLLVGPAGLGALTGDYPWLHYFTISNAEAIAPFAEFGIILLLFSIGLELSFKRLWGMRRLVFGVGAAELLVGGAIIGLGLWTIGGDWTGSFALGIALALSSTALVLPLVGTSSAVAMVAVSPGMEPTKSPKAAEQTITSRRSRTGDGLAGGEGRRLDPLQWPAAGRRVRGRRRGLADRAILKGIVKYIDEDSEELACP